MSQISPNWKMNSQNLSMPLRNLMVPKSPVARKLLQSYKTVSYTHLTLPTICSV